MNTTEIRNQSLEAEKRIRHHIRETPLEYSPYLSSLGNCEVWLKLESLQITGSFKLRGAANKLLGLSDQERARGVVTASSGNHGAAFAYMLGKLGWQGSIFLPANASGAKVDLLRQYGADLKHHGNDCVVAELTARRTAEENNQVFVSPYNDPEVIGGQGTIAIELERQLAGISAVFAPVGGGGLISGIAGCLKATNPGLEIIGCQPHNSAVMCESVKAGRILEMESRPTISDGTAGGVEAGSLTFAICSQLIDDWVLCTEEEIREAVRLVIQHHFLLVEGAAALTVAAFAKVKERFQGSRVVLILSGSKIGIDDLATVLETTGPQVLDPV